MKKAVLFVPFWGQPGHVGTIRIERFLRWLTEDGFRIVMIRGGSTDCVRSAPWGMEVTLRDPLGLYRDKRRDSTSSHRKPNRFRRKLAYWIFNPDPSVAWARRASRHPSVLDHAAGASFVLSSSPPESAHVGGNRLAKALGIPHLVDLRDGWLDEPSRPMLRTSRFRRWREGRLEASVLRSASRIFVTSDTWRDLLCKRMPEVGSKTVVVTNAYPVNVDTFSRKQRKPEDKGLTLVHAGRLTGSQFDRTASALLNPLLSGMDGVKCKGEVLFFGALAEDDISLLGRFSSEFAAHGWRVEARDSVSRSTMLDIIADADGLLLLSTFRAVIPAKLFEYIPSLRPMLVVSKKGSATWKLCEKLPQAFMSDLSDAPDAMGIRKFLEAARSGSDSWAVPVEYSDKYISRRFRDSVSLLLSGDHAEHRRG